MKIILILCLVVCFGLSANPNQTLVSEENWGNFTQVIQAKDEHANIPAQYYICGFDFLEKHWSLWLHNCDCGRKWIRGRRRSRCNWCTNNFWTRSSAVAIVFCNYNNWQDQIVKGFNTGSGGTRNWRGRRMCPVNTFATGFQGKYGAEHGVYLGLHGMLMRCTTPDYKTSQNIQDNQGHHSHFYAPRHGLFLSAFKVKYEPGGMLTGIHMFAEGMPIINDIKIDYNVTTAFQNYPVTFDIQSIENCGRQTAQKKVSFTKIYETVGQWNCNNPEVKGYLMMRNISMSPPSLTNSDPSINNIYKSTTSQFGFENPVKTVLSSNQEVLMFVTAGFQARIVSSLQEQKGSVPYKAYLTMVNMVTGDKIFEYTTTGTWQGVTTSSVDTKISEVAAVCDKDSNNNSNENSNGNSNNNSRDNSNNNNSNNNNSRDNSNNNNSNNNNPNENQGKNEERQNLRK